tara:strand:- start:710 stop:1243 length:534 start_codon:yes stop_codon:yes gene_type:complete
MKVNKFIKSKIERDYFFVTGKLDIDTEYFINQTEKGILANKNVEPNFKRLGPILVTEPTFFLKDKKFMTMILEFSDMIEEENFNEGRSWEIAHGWGLKQAYTHHTRFHNHFPSLISGSIMLNKHPQSLYFPDINEELKSEPGNFALFHAMLKHGNKERNDVDTFRYGLAFNYNIVNN